MLQRTGNTPRCARYGRGKGVGKPYGGRQGTHSTLTLFRRAPLNFEHWGHRIALLELDDTVRAYTPGGAGYSPHFAEEPAPRKARERNARTEDPAPYTVAPTPGDDGVIALALSILDARMRAPGDVLMTSPDYVKAYLRLNLAGLEYEAFMVLFLDAQHRLIEAKQLFRGTLTQTSVYPREVAKEALALNASALILAHNHPSGAVEPSRADELLTAALKQSLALFDVRVLDHFIVAGGRAGKVTSMAELGVI